MPLAFESLNHGTIAFGFFNIDMESVLPDSSANYTNVIQFVLTILPTDCMT
jgi:hypothetical protein